MTTSLTRALEAAPEINKATVTLGPPQARLQFGTTPLSRDAEMPLWSSSTRLASILPAPASGCLAAEQEYVKTLSQLAEQTEKPLP